MINPPKCYISQCKSKPYGKCDCSSKPVLFCKSHALWHIEDIENEKWHRCLKVYFKPDSYTKILINQKLIEMKESLQNSRTKLIKESKEIVEVVRYSLNKALGYINELEEKFNKLIDETRSEEVYDSPSENDFESIFKLSPLRAEVKLKEWQLLITNIDSSSIKENVKEVMNLSAPVFFKIFYENGKSNCKSSIIAEIFKPDKIALENQNSSLSGHIPAYGQTSLDSFWQFRDNELPYKNVADYRKLNALKSTDSIDWSQNILNSKKGTLHLKKSKNWYREQTNFGCGFIDIDYTHINAATDFMCKSVEELRFEDYKFNKLNLVENRHNKSLL